LLSLIFALALAAQDQQPAPPEAPAPAPDAATRRSGGPHSQRRAQDDYQFVGWCYGALRGYLDLHDEVMPEVTAHREHLPPAGLEPAGRSEGLCHMEKDGRAKLKMFQTALTAAERASPRPINVQGAAAVRQGQNIWRASGDVTKARKAQEWMSWVLPARCERIAGSLEARAKLSGAALRANAPKEEPAPEKLPEARPEAGPAQ
jgi:hypothetical protein